jgi:hypothetical protein
VLVSNLSPTVDYDELLCGFIQSFQTNVGLITLLGYHHFVPNPFKFIIYQSYY